MNAFDCHFHIIDPNFPLISNQNYLPPEFTVKDYQNEIKHNIKNIEIVGGAIVSGSFQLYDQTYLIDSLEQLNSSYYVGVTQLQTNVSDKEIIELNQKGVKAIRFNLRRGVSNDLKDIEYMANRVYDLVGWHSEFYLESNSLQDKELFNLLLSLPFISIDHLGMNKDGFHLLINLLEQHDHMFIKATGFGRVEFNDDEIETCIRTIIQIKSNRLVFGTDLPGTRARIPYQNTDLDIIIKAVGLEATEKILYDNALELYRIK